MKQSYHSDSPGVCVWSTGSSSFAFVEFYDAKDSARWMEKIEVYTFSTV